MGQGAGYITEQKRARLIRQIGRYLAAAETFWVFCHENPDGDTLGCSLAAYAGLTVAGKRVQLFTPNEVPRMYRFLPHAEQLRLVQELPAELPQVVLVVDNAAFDRVGRNYSEQLTARGIGPRAAFKAEGTVLINIDHHLGNLEYGEYNLVDPSCCACGELLYYAFKQLGLPLTVDVAVNLFATILTDTGRFSYGNTNYRSFIIASELIRLGVNPFEVVNKIYNNRTPEQILLLSLILNTIAEHEVERYFTCYVTQEMLEATKSVVSDTEGAVDIMKSVGEYDCCFLLKEESDGLVKVSGRSIREFDMRQFAMRFGGGGHPAASGFRINASISDAAGVLHAEFLKYKAELATAASAAKD
jgi:phosphoesterase RecJ-like protein